MDGRSEYASPALNALAGLQKAVHMLTNLMRHDLAPPAVGYRMRPHEALHRLDDVGRELSRTAEDLMRAHAAENAARENKRYEVPAQMNEADLAPPSVDLSISVSFDMTVDLIPAVDMNIPSALHLHGAAIRGLTSILVNNLDEHGLIEALPRLAGIGRCLDLAGAATHELYLAAS